MTNNYFLYLETDSGTVTLTYPTTLNSAKHQYNVLKMVPFTDDLNLKIWSISDNMAINIEEADIITA